MRPERAWSTPSRPSHPSAPPASRSKVLRSSVSRWSRSSTSSCARLVPVLRVAAHRLEHDRLERRRARRVAACGSASGSAWRCAAIVAIQLSPRERHATGEDLVHHHAPRVDVAARVAAVALDLLGAHVVGRAEALAEVTPREALGALEQRGAEVHELQRAVVGDDHVLGLEIAVHDAVRVQVRERVGELVPPVARELDRDRPVRGRGSADGGSRRRRTRARGTARCGSRDRRGCAARWGDRGARRSRPLAGSAGSCAGRRRGSGSGTSGRRASPVVGVERLVASRRTRPRRAPRRSRSGRSSIPAGSASGPSSTEEATPGGGGDRQRGCHGDGQRGDVIGCPALATRARPARSTAGRRRRALLRGHDCRPLRPSPRRQTTSHSPSVHSTKVSRCSTGWRIDVDLHAEVGAEAAASAATAPDARAPPRA